MDHLLLHCKFASVLWGEVLIMFGVQWVMLDTIVSPFCLEELVGNLLFKGLEYGSSMPYVVSLEGTQCLSF